MGNDTYISFYLSNNRIHVFRRAIKDLGNPKYIRFLLNEEGPSLIMESYDRMAFYAHRVKKGTDVKKGMEITSMPLCLLLKNRLGWEDGKSYRVHGKTYPKQHIAAFDLTDAERIES